MTEAPFAVSRYANDPRHLMFQRKSALPGVWEKTRPVMSWTDILARAAGAALLLGTLAGAIAIFL